MHAYIEITDIIEVECNKNIVSKAQVGFLFHNIVVCAISLNANSFILRKLSLFDNLLCQTLKVTLFEIHEILFLFASHSFQQFTRSFQISKCSIETTVRIRPSSDVDVLPRRI